MPQLGSDKNPIILNGSGKKSTRVLGLLGRAYSGTNKENFASAYPALTCIAEPLVEDTIVIHNLHVILSGLNNLTYTAGEVVSQAVSGATGIVKNTVTPGTQITIIT